ncbi:MAG: DUF523 domain-containing protein [Chloroflexi bacterium]|nr:DUF523 domain-containing protein [Chloroflexota bacterium]
MARRERATQGAGAAATGGAGAPVLVSACLLGLPCRYDGGHCLTPALLPWAAHGRLAPICPEVAGGLPTPRPPAEIQGGTAAEVWAGKAAVRSVQGRDVTPEYLAGARLALAQAHRLGARAAVLKQGSPSCGSRWVYDGAFQGQRIAGQGITAWLLRASGLQVASEDELAQVLGEQ